jgi:hypothetical protein
MRWLILRIWTIKDPNGRVGRGGVECWAFLERGQFSISMGGIDYCDLGMASENSMEMAIDEVWLSFGASRRIW